MKKNILKVMSLLFVALFLFVAGNRVFAKLSIPNNTKAKAPETVPSTSEILYGTTTEVFDFSKLKFSPASGSTEINGKSDLKKIILGKLKSIDSTSGLTLDSTFDKWFTAYCLDNNKKYPYFGLLTNDAYSNTASTDTDKLEQIIYAAIANDTNVQNAVKSKTALNNGNIDVLSLKSLDESEIYYELEGSDTAASIIANVESLNIPIHIKLKRIDYYRLESGFTPVLVGSVSATDISGNDGTTYDLSFNGKDILLDQYSVTDNRTVRGYDHALWIIEHSYPTLSIADTLALAKANYTLLKKEICELEGYTFANNICEGFADLDDYIENYVYGVVQYAIWKSTGHTVDGETLGNNVTNSVQLDKLYSYLIQNRSEYSGYSRKEFTNKVTINKPKEGKELYKETSSAYLYGPYSATYDTLDNNKLMNVSIKNTDKTGITLVDENGDELNEGEISKNQEFYIQCKKSANITSVTINVRLEDASVFDPLTNRGRIYIPKHVIEQNVMSGGKIVQKNIEQTADLLVNPKTGVENVALLLMVTLVAFTLAYLLLSYKQKPIQLS